MGFFDIVAAAMPWSESEAEAVSGGSSTVSTPANSGGKGEGEAIVRLLLSIILLFSFYLCVSLG